MVRLDLDARMARPLSTPLLTSNFIDICAMLGDPPHNLVLSDENPRMPELFLLRIVLRTISVVFGGFGVFYLILSWSAPALCGVALVLIGAASGIAYCLDR
jgi:hypothetical protein